MFWDNTRVGIKAAIGAAILSAGVAATAVPAMAQSVVVRSTGPSATQYPAGKKLASNARITLKSGDVITVLDKGGTRVLRGPQTVSLNRQVAGNARPSGMTNFLRTTSNRRARTGAVRSAGTAIPAARTGAVRSPNLWFVDVTRPGTYCIIDPKTTVLWRDSISSDMVGNLASTSGVQASEVTWRRGSARKLWPSDTVPLADGGRYTLAIAGAEKPAEITIKMVSNAPDDLDDAAAELIARGCQQQLDLLVDTLQAAEPAPATTASATAAE